MIKNWNALKGEQAVRRLSKIARETYDVSDFKVYERDGNLYKITENGGKVVEDITFEELNDFFEGWHEIAFADECEAIV